MAACRYLLNDITIYIWDIQLFCSLYMFGHYPTIHNPMVKQNILWIPLNVLCTKQSGKEQQRKYKIHFSFIPNNTKWYGEKWNVSSRGTYGTKAQGHTGCLMLTKTTNTRHPKIKHFLASTGVPTKTSYLDDQTGLQVPYTGGKKEEKKVDCLCNIPMIRICETYIECL